MPTVDMKKLDQLLQLLNSIGKSTGHPDISLHGLKVLVTAAAAAERGEPMEGRQIADRTGISHSGVSRAVGTLGEWSRAQKPGLGLLEAKPDMSDRRRKPVTLTYRGRKCLEAILREF